MVVGLSSGGIAHAFAIFVRRSGGLARWSTHSYGGLPASKVVDGLRELLEPSHGWLAASTATRPRCDEV